MEDGKTKVLVLGGGLSGLATSALLAESGRFDVTIIEGRKLFGGQACGWEDSDGDPVETGIHILFPWYENLVRFYKNLGHPLPLVPTDGYYYVLDGKYKDTVVFETTRSLWGDFKAIWSYPRLTVRDKYRMARIVLEALRLSPEQAEQYDGWTVRAFLMSRKASPELVAFFEIATITIQGLWGWEASAASFLKFLKCLFGSETDMTASFLSKPTHECMVAPLVEHVERHGGVLKSGERVEAVDINEGQVQSVRTDAGKYDDFDLVLSALPAYILPKVLPGELHPQVAGLCRYQSAHVICLQLHYDRCCFPHGNVYVSNRQGVIFDSICDKAYHWAEHKEGGSIIQVLIDNSREYEAASDAFLLEEVLGDLHTFFPETKDANLEKHHVLRHDMIYTETRTNY
ncbi:MAG: FAD-dependent oxidoreductase, partial [Pirellulales bacterium]|nr:FAD-dependent oxidoreductase [Pirellulales bacterium]